MNNGKILVATDFSAHAALALEQAYDCARSNGAHVIIVHVMESPDPDEGEGMLHDGAYADLSQVLSRRLQGLSDAGSGLSSEWRLLRGDAAKEILRLAAEEGVGMIVMGTHGRTGVVRVLMGSVAERVMRGATCNVLIVKRPQADACA